MTNITTIGVDLAKELYAHCAMDVTGAVVYHKVLKRNTFVIWAEQLLPSNVVIEAFG